MEVREIAEGLWRWTAPHPDWTPDRDVPGGWGQRVGCIYYEPPAGDALVLVDPLVPPAESPDRERFWSALDRDVARFGAPVAVLISNRFHGRSAREIYRRYSGSVGVTVHLPRGAEGHAACDPTHVFGSGEPLPGGVAAHFIEGLVEPEVAFHLVPHRALVLADAVIGSGNGQVRVAPASWAGGVEAAARYAQRFRASLARLVELDPDRLLTSHGEPVLARGRQCLAEALAAPAWGEP